MSYIFEALKKLEQKRERDRGSRLLMVTGEPGPERKRWPFWSFSVLAALLLLNAGVMFWWVHPRVPEKQLTPTKPPAINEDRSENSATTRQGASEQGRPVDLKQPGLTNSTSGPMTPVPEKKAPGISLTDQASTPKPADAAPKLRPVNRPAADMKVLDLKELPAAIKDSLPELKISAHYYTADPKTRFTRINDLNLREGQVLTPGLKLEEITPDGVVLSYQGYRFRMGISESR
jgi:general secretion pathway protein B